MLNFPTVASMNMFLESGPIAVAEIYVDELSFLQTKNEWSNAPYARVRMLIDTGSSISGIDKNIIKTLKLPKYNGCSEVDGVGGIHSLNRYRCVLFLNIFGLKGLPIDVLEGDYSGSPYDGVLGRDVLQFCSFNFNGPSNTFDIKAPGF